MPTPAASVLIFLLSQLELRVEAARPAEESRKLLLLTFLECAKCLGLRTGGPPLARLGASPFYLHGSAEVPGKAPEEWVPAGLSGHHLAQRCPEHPAGRSPARVQFCIWP